MTARIPLVNVAGILQEMPTGDVVPTANGGTGLTSPGTSGNVLTSNGTDWVSSAAAGGTSQPALNVLLYQNFGGF